VSAFLSIIPADTPPELKNAVIECCMYDPSARPTFESLVEHWEATIQEWEKSDDSHIERARLPQTTSGALDRFRKQAITLRKEIMEQGAIRQRHEMHTETEHRKRNPIILTPVVTKEKHAMLVRPNVKNRANTAQKVMGLELVEAFAQNLQRIRQRAAATRGEG